MECNHDWKQTGGTNAGCSDECTCSVPVYRCSKCWDLDFGENPEADKIREKCKDPDLDPDYDNYERDLADAITRSEDTQLPLFRKGDIE